MDPAELMCVQVNERGKWHVLSFALAKITACGERVGVNPKIRSLELIDSSERCRSTGCINARNKARGLT